MKVSSLIYVILSSVISLSFKILAFLFFKLCTEKQCHDFVMYLFFLTILYTIIIWISFAIWVSEVRRAITTFKVQLLRLTFPCFVWSGTRVRIHVVHYPWWVYVYVREDIYYNSLINCTLQTVKQLLKCRWKFEFFSTESSLQHCQPMPSMGHQEQVASALASQQVQPWGTAFTHPLWTPDFYMYAPLPVTW